MPTIEVIFRSEELLVVNKPANVSLLADRSGAKNLWDELKAEHGKLFLVHRLDKGTSGVLLVARTQSTQRRLTRAFQARAVTKFYLAGVSGKWAMDGSIKIDLPLCKGRKSRYRVAAERGAIEHDRNQFSVVQDRPGVDALTRVRRLTGSDEVTWLLVKPVTGRSHQIRVHLAWLGFPLLGDHLYGPKGNSMSAMRLMLHCHRLTVPGYGTFVSPSPESFTAFKVA